MSSDSSVQGCIGETVSAALAAAARDAATDEEVVDALTRIASDEARHARLAWSTAKWALSKGDASVRAAVEKVLFDPDAWAPGPSEDAGEEGEVHGRLTAASQKRVIKDAIRYVVRVCAAVLLGHQAGPPEDLIEVASLREVRESVMQALLA